MAVRVQARDFGFRHAARRNPTLAHVNFTIEPGEKVLIVGASGSGKSTLVAGIAGVLGDDTDGEYSGELLIGDRPAHRTRGVVGLVLQDPDSQVIASRVGDDIAFGCENLAMPREEIWQRVAWARDLVGLTVSLDHPTHVLSGGQKQRLALAGVLAMGAEVIVLDEPTANIDPAGVTDVHDAVARAVADTGATLIIVEHAVEQWRDIVDRVLVLGTDGTIVADGPYDEVFRTHGEELAAQGIWVPNVPLDLDMAWTGQVNPEPITAAPLDADSDVLLAAHNLAVGWQQSTPVHRGIRLELDHRAAVITGPNGAGKSTLALTLAGLLAPCDGEVSAAALVHGRAGRNPSYCEAAASRTDGPGQRRGSNRTTTSSATPYGKRNRLHPRRAKDHAANPLAWSSRALVRRIGMVFQEPEHQFVARTVEDELLLGPRLVGMDADDAQHHVQELLRRLRLDAVAKANPFSLSGGQKRRLSVATVLSTRPQFVILDEPTFGQDRVTFTELITLLRELSESGVGIAAITHDPLVLHTLGQRHLRMEAQPR